MVRMKKFLSKVKELLRTHNLTQEYCGTVSPLIPIESG